MSHTKPELSAKDDLPSEARVQSTTELQLRQDRLEQVRIPLEIRFENLLTLFDSLVASSLRASAKSNNHYDEFIADSLNYDLSELRTWKEKIKAMMPNEESSRNSLRILDKLEGPVVATLLNIVGRMETDLWELSADIADNNSIFSEQFRAACDRLETSIIRLLALHHELIAELTTREGDIRNILNGERDTKNHRLPVVCFDGGGVRSYSSLVIFEALMDEVRVVAEQSEGNANAQSIRPCDVFIYMFGSSSGGLVAIMLGRLKMTLEQCKEAFRTHAKSIFYRPQRLDYVFPGLTTSKYSEDDLVQATKTVIESFDPTPESQKWKRNMFAATAERCGCGVFAYAKPNDYVGEGVPYIFRTYNNTSSDARNPRKAHKCDIWEFVLATAAAPSYFPAAKVDGKEYLDGGFAANNPSEEAVTELLTLHPKNPICLVSIGSGKRKAVGDISSGVFGRYYYDYLNAAAFATNTESAHRHMRQIAAFSDRLSYFRFDVSGLEDVLLDECTVKTRKQWPHVGKLHTIDFIELQTKQYLAQDETRISIRACAQMLVDSYYSSVGSSVSDRRA